MQSKDQTDSSTVRSAPAGYGKKGSSVSSWYENGANGAGIVGFTQKITTPELAKGNVVQSWLELYAASNDNSKNVYVIHNANGEGRSLESKTACGELKDMA